MTQTAELGIHLHCHSEYSLAAGLLRLSGKNNIAQLAKSRNIGALALTDDNSICGAIKFFRCCQAAGVKPIIGCIARAAYGADDEFRLTLLVRDDEGFGSLCRILTEAQQNKERRGVIDARSINSDTAAGLFILGGFESDIGRAISIGKQALAKDLLANWRKQLGENYFAELTLAGRSGENATVAQIAQFASELQIPAIAAHPVLFANSSDFTSHEIRACITTSRRLDDPNRPHNTTPEQYMLDAGELETVFSKFPGALDNARELALRCNYSFADHDALKLPKIDSAGGDSQQQLRAAAQEGIAKHGLAGKPEYEQRLEHELKTIVSQGFADYYLIVADFVRFANEKSIPVGPGRGSGAGSLVAYALGITGIDPLKYGLLFERFLNPERVSQPDFDIDFCMDQRDQVISYVHEKYGAESVSQIATFGTLAAKAAVRDIGRALGVPYSRCDTLARLIPFELNTTLARAKSEVAALREMLDEDQECNRLWGYAEVLEGLPRNAGTHAGGVLIAPSAMTDFCPLMHVSDDAATGLVSQFDKDDLKDIGLVKFDFLGLRTLTMIDAAVKLIAREGIMLTAETIPLDDPETFRTYCRTDTIGVFQCEAPGMRDVMRSMKPKSLEDIAVLISLYRPGPIKAGMIDSYLKRRAGEEKTSYPHAAVETVLSPTYGTIVFQEQVMQMAQKLANYTMGEADVLRKAMGDKDPEIMERERTRFINGTAEADTLKKPAANELFDRVAEFAGYAFNKAHAVGYAILSVQTAYLKTHHPAAFYAAMLSTSAHDIAAVAKLRDDAAKHKIEVLQPCVNESAAVFEPASASSVRYGLAAIRSVGMTAAVAIVDARQRSGKFENLVDLCTHCPQQILSRRGLENMIRSGACDSLAKQNGASLGNIRSWLMSELGPSMAAAGRRRENENQDALFAEHADMPAPRTNAVSWTRSTTLHEEYTALGVTLSGHFYDTAKWLLRTPRIKPLAQVDRNEQGNWAGCVLDTKTPVAWRKIGVELVLIDDGKDRLEIRVPINIKPETPLKAGDIVICSGTIKLSSREEPRLHATKIMTLDEWCQERIAQIRLSFSKDQAETVISTVKSWKQGKSKVLLSIAADGYIGDVDLGVPKAPASASLMLLQEQLDDSRKVQVSYA